MSLQINTHRVTAKIPNIEYTEATHVYNAYKTVRFNLKSMFRSTLFLLFLCASMCFKTILH